MRTPSVEATNCVTGSSIAGVTSFSMSINRMRSKRIPTSITRILYHASLSRAIVPTAKASLFRQQWAGISKGLHLFLNIKKSHVHRGGNAQIEGENLAGQAPQHLFVGGRRLLARLNVGTVFAGEHGDTTHPPISIP